MLRAMVFIDYENYNIALNNYYRKYLNKPLPNNQNNTSTTPNKITVPKINLIRLSKELVKLLPEEHSWVKTYIFVPKPDDFLMQETWRENTYKWATGLNNLPCIKVVEGEHIARPVDGYTKNTMDIKNPQTYYVEEKGTDVNLTINVLTKAFHNAYDTAIIVSGDNDYIPVMDILDTIGKSVVVVGIHGQTLAKSKSHADLQLFLDDRFFQRCAITPNKRQR